MMYGNAYGWRDPATGKLHWLDPRDVIIKCNVPERNLRGRSPLREFTDRQRGDVSE